jgi:uncharacterized membrane protein (DUF4010 family)
VSNTLINLALSLAAGLIVGLERGWQERTAAEGSRIAGVRTFGLIGLFGGLAALLAESAGQILLGFAFLAFALLMVISHVAEARDSKDYGVTTLIAALITFALGALSVREQQAIAATGAVVTAILLSLKPVLHRWLKRIEPAELYAALKLLLISVVILPVLPDRGFGPWQALNPYELWWLVVLIAGISFAAYIAVKIAGAERGILLTGLLGGMVSSTAVSLHLARLAKTVEQSNILAGGILVASAVMFVRVLLVATIINPAMSMLKWPLVAMTAVLVVSAVLYARRVPQMTLEAVRLRNPVELTQALRFGVLLMGIVLVSKGMQEWLGYAGLYLVAAIAGIADVDAITISLSRMSKAGLSLGSASQAVILATIVNTLTKGVLVGSVGGKALLSKVILPIIICALIGTLSIWQLAQ